LNTGQSGTNNEGPSIKDIYNHLCCCCSLLAQEKNKKKKVDLKAVESAATVNIQQQEWMNDDGTSNKSVE
jgi:TFIIF-interacting CTD phosphatase-like protein